MGVGVGVGVGVGGGAGVGYYEKHYYCSCDYWPSSFSLDLQFVLVGGVGLREFGVYAVNLGL